MRGEEGGWDTRKNIRILKFEMPKRMRVFGNDDDRPILVFTDELHPTSRLRGVIEHDAPDELTLGCSRDCLRSLVASQRCGRQIIKGDATEAELHAELDRDCVHIQAVVHAPSSMVALCRGLAHTLAHWPRMTGGMEAHMKGGKTEWDSGPMHCVVRFVSKPARKTSKERPLGSLLHALIRWMFEHTGRRSVDEILGRVQHECIDQLLVGDPYWFVQYDDNRRLSRDVIVLADEVRSRRDKGDVWCAVVICKLEDFHERMVDLTRLFYDKHAVGFELLKDELLAHRLRMTVEDNEHRSYPALIFPTAWCVDRTRHTGISVLLQQI